MGKHNHTCPCKHEDIKYCSHCRVVHCKDCGREWKDNLSGYWYYPTYWGGVQDYTTWCGDSTGQTGGATLTTTDGTCSHARK